MPIHDIPADGRRELPSNEELARLFHEIGDLLEIRGDLVFKVTAYHRAADAIAAAPVGLAEACLEGRLPKLPGVGSAITEKLEERVRTGRLAYHERLTAELPASLVELLGIPGVGPRTVGLLHRELGIATIEALHAAATSGRLRGLRGISTRTEQQILAGLERLAERGRRRRIHDAAALADRIVTIVGTVPGVRRVAVAGSLRRRRETIGDLDILAETDDPGPLVDRFVELPRVREVIARGERKAAVSLADGPNVDLMIMPPGECGTYLVHFTGSKEHNVRLRARARDLGWSLSEKGFLKLDPETGEPLTGADAELRTMADETEVYEFLGLPFIEPELREDGGEIEAALAGRLPRLVAEVDLRGDLHSHSDWSDGTDTVEAMAEAARRLGRSYQVLTDHSQSLQIANGLSPERVEAQRAVISALNARFAREEAAGRLPDGADPGGFRLLHGCELEIRTDGRLDYDDALLAAFDVVVAALHVGRGQPRAQLTERVLAAIRNPHVDVIAHPAGRKVLGRPDLDLDWDSIFGAAAAAGTILEMNGSPDRLDLSVERARRAVAAGCRLAVDSDAHAIAELDFVRWGVSQARRAWVTPESVVNAWPREQLLDWLRSRSAVRP